MDQQQEDEGTVGRNNATMLPAVCEPESWMGSPMLIGLFGDLGLLGLVLIGVVAADINSAWLLAAPAWHGLAVGIRARSVHADRLLGCWISKPRPAPPHPAQVKRAAGAKAWLEA